jgi:hypothetical protein
VAQYDNRFAAWERDSGVRKVGRLTWRAGLIGVAFSALFGAALAHPADTGHQGHHQPGGIVIPGQPPQQGSGSGQVTSGAS